MPLNVERWYPCHRRIHILVDTGPWWGLRAPRRATDHRQCTLTMPMSADFRNDLEHTFTPLFSSFIITLMFLPRLDATLIDSGIHLSTDLWLLVSRVTRRRTRNTRDPNICFLGRGASLKPGMYQRGNRKPHHTHAQPAKTCHQKHTAIRQPAQARAPHCSLWA